MLGVKLWEQKSTRSGHVNAQAKTTVAYEGGVQKTSHSRNV